MTVDEVLTEWAEDRQGFAGEINAFKKHAETIFSQLHVVCSEMQEKVPQFCSQYNLGDIQVTLSELEKDGLQWQQRLTIDTTHWLFEYNLLPSKLEREHRCLAHLRGNVDVTALFVWSWEEDKEVALVRADAYITIDGQWTPQVGSLQGLEPLTRERAKNFITLVIHTALKHPTSFWYDMRKKYKDGIPVGELTESKKSRLPRVGF